MGRRRHDNINAVASFFDGFNQSYDTVGRVLQDMEMSKVARAEVEKGADELEQGPATTVTIPAVAGEPGGQATPVTVPGESKLKPVSTFLGQKVDPANTDQVERLRAGRMADVLSKYDPRAGMQMRRELKREDREGERYAWEKNRAERDERQAGQAEADAKTLRDIDGQVGTWFQQQLANPDGTQRAATVDDHLGATQQRAALLLQKGRTKEAGETMSEYAARAHGKLKLEEAERKDALTRVLPAVQQGNLQAAADYYNRYIPDGARITQIVPGKGGALVLQRESFDGKPLPPQTLNGGARELDTLLQATVNTDAMRQFSTDEFNRNMALRRDQRDGAQLGLAQAGNRRAEELHQAGAPERGVASRLGQLQQVLMDPKATEQEKTQAGAMIMQVQNARTGGKGGGGSVPAEIQVAREFMRTGAFGVKTEAEAYEAVRRLKEKSPSDVHMELVKASMAGEPKEKVAEADAMMSAMGYTKGPRGWAQSGGGAADSAPTFDSEAAVEAAAKAGKIKPGDRVMVGGRSAIWR